MNKKTRKSKPTASIVVVVDENNGIGKDNELLCHLPNDLKHFKNITLNNTIIMGRRTLEAMPNGAALPKRTNIVITSNKELQFDNCVILHSLPEVWEYCKDEEEIFFIGGGQIYNAVIDDVDKLYITRIHHTFEGADTFFPKIDLNNWELMEEEKHQADEKHKYDYTFQTYIRKE
ncbi:MAG TPA: dihydrofolate reductase [Dysgonamonadaceae bacterium]|nr:dihydrofolate reductase [Dysgonamonadaceae bacterium]